MLYAKILSPESTDSKSYLMDFIDSYEDIIIDGGREYESFNDSILCDIKKMINYYNGYDYEVYYKNSIMNYLADMLPKKYNGKRISPNEAKQIKTLLDNNCSDEDIIIKCLYILTHKYYNCVGLRGYCQGDYVDCYYPNIYSRSMISELESLYWNTGVEVVIQDSDEPVNGPDDIDGYCDYITSWPVKKELAERYGFPENEVVLYEFKRYIKVPVYELAD